MALVQEKLICSNDFDSYVVKDDVTNIWTAIRVVNRTARGIDIAMRLDSTQYTGRTITGGDREVALSPTIQLVEVDLPEKSRKAWRPVGRLAVAIKRV